MRFRTWALRVGATVVGTCSAAVARADWYINGQWQPCIPFWYTLEEAVAAYFGLK